ncbi:MAG: hypothetical protein A2W93_00630 [Bacteroidetes bacterium GWF2_43_63]|nr:MAG: hypothetical protein A2W94_12890 [Bacteroidetes bacterium GWE2_42_42]OFY53904.1 MAG: hypothetical protein A2W93_00630 [Bacteroidetes bacterium GWF2_43_63]HBG69869.1 hypothetical protein [Bacteroidales bacterium]HCB60934.1 hypothetical protein [Bacteroidales bacterium]HCY24490.1 hypothetical protein [Bacteroidales bacterium]
MKKLLIKSIFILLAIGLLFSCQIEKRQYVKGFFVSNPASEHSSRSESNQLTDTFIDNVDTVQGADVAKTQLEKISAPDQTNDSLQTENFSKETVFTKSISNIESGLSTAFKHLLLRKTSLLTSIPATFGARKLHPLAIWAFVMIATGFLALILGVYFEAGALAFVFLGLLIAAWVFLLMAIIKTKENPQQWNGLIIENFILVMLSLVVFSFVLGMALLTL